ncbi:MAG: homocysteine S-methyltransferase family protein [Oscillospiraceae bacterium]|jgi:5-methyltetrahydrofolate--homocysteine methyltransferase|nr:homocysteine S-methyltransferase family protein [Oscillospiraceae bacterium]
MKFNAAELTRTEALLFSGALGTQLQAFGLPPGQLPEMWNLTHPREVTRLHREYIDAGARVIETNTFGANRMKYPNNLEEIIAAAVANARRAVAESGRRDCFIALDIGASGKLLEPMGTFPFEDAAALFRETAALGAKHGVDFILIETMTDALEAKAAVLGAKEGAPDLPVCCTLAFETNGRLLTGATPAAAAVLLEGLRVDALGVNCGAGPRHAARLLPEMLANVRCPVICVPNAGMPRVENGKTVFDLAPDAFAAQMLEIFESGAAILGGCCGTTPAHIAALANCLRGRRPPKRDVLRVPRIASATEVVAFAEKPVLIGERINPTGKPTFQRALRAGDLEAIENAARAQYEAGAQVLDINVGLPDIDETAMMLRAVRRVEQAVPIPLQIDSNTPDVLEAGLRSYGGKALINSMNGKAHSMKTVLPLVKKYGGVVVALLLDENGIPPDVEGRLAIAERIYKEAAAYGLGKEDILIDALTLTVSSEPTSPAVTLEAVRRIREMGGWTVLGVSNVSFGLPRREGVNAAFFTLAMQAGLSAAILNPNAEAMMTAYRSYCLLNGMDRGAEDYIAHANTLPASAAATARPQTAAPPGDSAVPHSPLAAAILAGRTEAAEAQTQSLLQSVPPMDILQKELLPALDAAGKGFAAGTLFLPQLLRGANAAKAALALVQQRIRQSGGEAPPRAKIVLATVHGDIHDIGKNIFKTLLETYHFAVVDLGKDVPPEAVTAAVLEHNAPLCGLSALMTTTVPAMEATIRLLREKAPRCKVLVGGAVLNQAYADAIGADCYCPDAMAGVKACERLTAEAG